MAAYVTHKRATFDYEILEQYEAGIELFGFEVKSVRGGMGKLEGAHITVRGGEAYLINSEIPAYQPANAPGDYDVKRNRRLLLQKNQLAEIAQAEDKKGLTIIPLSMYNKGRHIKLAVAIVRGKKKINKRETLKKREHERDVARAMKGTR